MKLKNHKEIRYFFVPDEKYQTRAITKDTDSSPNFFEGYASVFEVPSKQIVDFDENFELIEFYEVINRGAFDDVLASPDLDCIYCVDHSRDKLIARTKSGTLSLTVDEFGLKFNAIKPNTSVANDLFEHVRLRNYSENSFAFTVIDETWEQKPDGLYRYINKIGTLYDVSTVLNPAYNNTSVSVRGLDELKQFAKPKAVEPVAASTPETVAPPVPDNTHALIDLDIFLAQQSAIDLR